MSTTRCQKRSSGKLPNVSEALISRVVGGNSEFLDKDAPTTGPSSANAARIENKVLESLRASLREEIGSENKDLLIDPQKEMMKLLEPATGANVREEDENDLENETRSLHTLTKSVTKNSTHNNDPCTPPINQRGQKEGLRANQRLKTVP